MIPLGPKPRISPTAIKADLNANWADIGPLGVARKPNKKVITFELGRNAEVMLTLVKTSIPWSELKKPYASSVLWPDAMAQLRHHRAFLVITLKASPELRPLDKSQLLTQVTASVLRTCPVALGVLWCNAALLISPELFQEYALKILPLGPPIPIWIDIRITPTSQGRMSGYTTGLEALGHMEIETENAPETAAELRTRFEGLVAYLLKYGPVIHDGDTIGEGADEKIRVVYSPSIFGRGGTILRIDYEASDPHPVCDASFIVDDP